MKSSNGANTLMEAEMRILWRQKRHSYNVETGLVEFPRQHMVLRRIAPILIMVGLAWAPMIAAPHLSNPRFSSDGVELSGELRAVNLFDQTLLIWRDDGKVETVPFSKWTDFIRVSTDSRGRKVRQPIEPTDIEIGERLFILLAPNGATAELVEVLPPWDEITCYTK
jgi:hypothetical protein